MTISILWTVTCVGATWLWLRAGTRVGTATCVLIVLAFVIGYLLGGSTLAFSGAASCVLGSIFGVYRAGLEIA